MFLITKLKLNFLLGVCIRVFATSTLNLHVNGDWIAQPQDHNYLRLDDNVISLNVCEHSKQHVECAENTVIRVVKANYGRTDLTTCDMDPDKKWAVNCGNKAKAEEVVIGKCNGQNSCEVQASNSVFGDPCPGTIKYLEVKHLCVNGVTTHVCQNSNLHMKCDAGKVIHILEANYGRTTLGKCSSDNSDLVRNLKCISSNSKEVISQKCNGQNSCEVQASNSVFGDPCPGTLKYLELKHLCIDDVTTLACQDSNLHLTCEAGKVIQILEGNYGRTSGDKCYLIIPEAVRNTKCISSNSTEIVRQKCNGKNSCDVRASNSVFGDPCSGTYKFLEVKHLCIPDVTTRVCQDDNLHLTCETGKVIQILEGNYGRTSADKCYLIIPEAVRNTKCISSSSTEIIRQKCNGKNSCDVRASNSVFGDPCSDTYKYLEVKHLCIPENNPISTHVCEHNNLHVKCDAGEVIHFLEAYYGRTTLGMCSSYNSNWNLKCISSNSEDIIRQMCHQKRSCDIEASDSVFGDPCPGTMKYVELQYYCSPMK